MLQVENLYAREKILLALQQVNHSVETTFKSFTLDEFFSRPGQRWSAYDTLRHLTKSVKPVTLALRLPRQVLGLLFGKPGETSRRYEQMKSAYDSALRAGAQAGRFAPDLKEIPPTEEGAERARRTAILKWRRAGRNLVAAVDRWPNYKMDKYRLPHPILGKLTVREMLFFTINHNLHHLNTAQVRVREMRQQDG